MWIILCRHSVLDRRKPFPHTPQTNGRAPVCDGIFRWMVSVYLVLNTFPHCSHLYGGLIGPGRAGDPSSDFWLESLLVAAPTSLISSLPVDARGRFDFRGSGLELGPKEASRKYEYSPCVSVWLVGFAAERK